MRTGCWGTCPMQELGPKAAEAVALLALVAGQDVEPVDGSDGTDGRWRIARRVAPDRVISCVDPDARHAHKTVHRRQDGFKAHLAVEPDTGLITDCRADHGRRRGHPTTPRSALGPARPAKHRHRPVQVLADSAYGTGDAARRAGRRRAQRDHQAVAAAPGGPRRVHPRRLHRRRRTPGR